VQVSAILTLVILALTLFVWAFFYILTTTEPLTLGDTTIVVGACAVVVFLVKRVAPRIRRGGRRDETEP
jgi:hypothetical protein